MDLAARVESLERQLKELRSEWTDVLDKMLAREDRLRKRYARELKAAVDDDAEDTPRAVPSVQPVGDAKTAIRQRVALAARANR